MELINQRK